MDIRQSKQYAKFIQSLGWKVEQVGHWNAFIKPFPLIGSFIKIQRIRNPVPWKLIYSLSKKYKARITIIEPLSPLPNRQLPTTNPYSPSKTIHIGLSLSEKSLFNRFKPATRRAVRKAIKNNITIQQSRTIDIFIKLKSKHLFPMGFLMKKEIRSLWETFYPNRASLLLASRQNNEYIAGILLLFHQKTAYYWLAVSTKQGKKLFAPTLLVWEALKLSKKRGCTLFDFEGIYDERFPAETKNWKGFTRFKKGFGGKEVEYPKPISVSI